MSFVTCVPIQCVIMTFHENKDLLIKELRKKLYPMSAYYLSLAVPTIPVFLFDFTYLTIPIYFITGMNLSTWTNILVFCAINVSGWWIAEAWGILISIIGGTAERSTLLLPVAYLPF